MATTMNSGQMLVFLRQSNRRHGALPSRSLFPQSRFSSINTFPPLSISISKNISDDFKIRSSNADSVPPNLNPRQSVLSKVLSAFKNLIKSVLIALKNLFKFVFTETHIRFFASAFFTYLETRFPLIRQVLNIVVRFRTLYLGSGDLWKVGKDVFPEKTPENTVEMNSKFLGYVVESLEPSHEQIMPGADDKANGSDSKQEYAHLCDWIKHHLGNKVAMVQVSNRLSSSSPCVLVAMKFGWSPNRERLMKTQRLGETSSGEFTWERRIVLEVFPDHPIIKYLNAACKKEPESTDAKRAVDLLNDTALISSGFMPDSPAVLGGKVYEMMAMALRGRWERSDS